MSRITYGERVHEIEKKWQGYWERNHVFRAPNPGEPGADKEKYYALVMFPYPSGDGLHVGHPLSYTAVDIVSRYKRMKGFNVLHPMGWDAFGLPAEQFAIQRGIHPAITTVKNIATFKRQLTQLGMSYDWSREINTTDPAYVKWTQWIFKKLYERGLAYEKQGLVNWCPALGTVLANDEVIDGKSERGGHPVERRPMRQWYLKITEYAERLLKDLDLVDWPEATKDMQRNWIGKSEGARVRFALAQDSKQNLEVFTTRPDTLMGVTFMVVAPEHPLLQVLTTPEHKSAVEDYVKAAAGKSDLQRTDLNKDKSGVPTGGFVIHPLNGQKIPVWVADYVLINYGTGAIMAVPAHDERDQEFATKFSIPQIPVIDENGCMINSDSAELKLNGLSQAQGTQRILELLEKKGLGQKEVNYRLRDWAFSRQRYWGEPFPLIHIQDGPDQGQVRLMPDEQLPLKLPDVQNYAPSGSGESPLASIPEWIQCKDPVSGATALRESNTMPGSAASSWYFLRFIDANNDHEPWSSQAEKYWMPVDLYVGGTEHTVGHLLYSRFWHKVFFDLGLVHTPEPFKKLCHQGMMLGEDNEKMSKSRGNVVSVDSVIESHGADTLRTFEMFLGPIEREKPWQTKGIDGVSRFLNRVWNIVLNDSANGLATWIQDKPQDQWSPELNGLLHKTIKQVGEDIENLRINTAVSALMILTNELYAHKDQKGFVPLEVIEKLVLMLAPFAPHLGEELWLLLGNQRTLAYESWPEYDPSKLVSDQMELPVQINGKLRDKVLVPRTISEEDIKALVLGREAVIKWIEGAPVKKFIFVRDRMVSIVK